MPTYFDISRPPAPGQAPMNGEGYGPVATDGLLRRGARAAFCSLYRRGGLMSLQLALRSKERRSSTSIVLFHRVTDQIPADGLTVSTAWFRTFCRIMAKYRVVPLAEIYRLVKEGEVLPPRTLAITFDDSYRDNLEAARVLSEHGLPATFFIPTQYVGSDFVFPWDRHLPRMPHLGWDDLRAMKRLGHDFGSHTVSHPDMATLSNEDARWELTESRRVLEAELGQPIRWFAYPYGGPECFRSDQLTLVRDAGFELCLSAARGFLERGMEGQVLPRLAMPSLRNFDHMELYLNRCLDWMYDLKRALGGETRSDAPLTPPELKQCPRERS